MNNNRIKLYIIVLSLVGVIGLLTSATAGDLVYSTYLGGGDWDRGWGIAVDSSGNAYITGYTYSSDFPTTPGAFDTTYNGGDNEGDIFVSKLNASGTALVYSTYLGGGGYDEGYIVSYGIAVDGSGNAYITGDTYSSDFPTTPGAFDTSYNGAASGWGGGDAFVTKLNPSGTALVYSTYLGGIGDEWGWSIAIDSSGNAYITGFTYSPDFPTTPGAFDTSFNGGIDVFVTKLNPSGTALVYSTCLGSGYGYGIAVDGSGNAYITGFTYEGFPTTPGAFDTSFNGGNGDVFVTKLNSSGTALVYSSYLGGGDADWGRSIAVDGSGNAYITGLTYSSDFPTTPGALDTLFNGGYGSDVFVTKLNTSGTALVYSTYLGGGDDEWGWGIAIDGSENAYITGLTASSNFPTTPGAFDTLFNGNYDVFVSKLNAGGTALVYSTYLGGGGNDEGRAIALDSLGNAYITGLTYSSDFPTTPGAYDITDHSCFVSKFSFAPLSGNILYSDINQSSAVDQGDTLTIQLDKRVQVNGATASDFYLPVASDSLGTGATVSINTANDTQVLITLGASPTLTIPGGFDIGNTTPGSPTGLDISSTMAPNAIENFDGIDAQPSGAKDIRYTLLGTSIAVPAFSSATVQVSQDTSNAYYTEHKLVIPEDSLSVSTTITVSPPGDNHGELSAVSFSPPTLTFSTTIPAILVIEYKDADTKREAGYMETAMRIHQWKDATTGWVLIPQTYSMQSVDTNIKTVQVNIDQFNMVLAPNTTIVYANIALPTVHATSSMVAAAPSGFWPDFAEASSGKSEIRFFSGTSITLSVGTAGIYTNHKLTLTDYTTSYSGVTVILTQATLAEMHNHPNYAVMKIITLGEITTRAILTMEYKDQDDVNHQFTNDVISGEEFQMRIYRWQGTWERVPGTQTLNTTANLVSVELDNITAAQIYAVKVEQPYILTVQSYPDTGASISVTPNDIYGDGSGMTNFTRNYFSGATVTLTAPSVYNGKYFIKWTNDSLDCATTLTVNVAIDNTHTLVAVYQSPVAVDYPWELYYFDKENTNYYKF